MTCKKDLVAKTPQESSEGLFSLLQGTETDLELFIMEC